jgi:nicotinate-nucleotide adenylyltransferase
MVTEAVRADPRFAVSTVELDRSGPSYTIDTVRALRSERPDADFYLIIGVDQFKELDSWHEPEALVRSVHLVVMDREGRSARAAAAGVPGGEGALFVPVRRVDVSSTGIRAAVRAGEDVTDRVPPGIATIIERERLYSGL